MSVKFGFYNSVNGDRIYDATDVSRLFTGLIADGVFSTVGDHFNVRVGLNMDVILETGKAWFNNTWTENDADLTFVIDAAEVVLNRIDTLVLEVDASEATRSNSVKIIKGVPGTEPVAPTMVNTVDVHQYPLCDIRVDAGVTAFTSDKLTQRVGTEDTPFVTGLLEQANIDSIFLGWTESFNSWFDDMKDQLSVDAAGSLQNQIDDLEVVVENFSGGTDPVTVTVSGNITAVEGMFYALDLSSMGDFYDVILEAPTEIGVEIGVYISDKSTTKAMRIKPDTGVLIDDQTAEWKGVDRGLLFKTGEHVVFKAISLTKWVTVVDGRIPSFTYLENTSVMSMPNSVIIDFIADQVVYDNADATAVANRIAVRRKNVYQQGTFLAANLNDRGSITIMGMYAEDGWHSRKDTFVSSSTPLSFTAANYTTMRLYDLSNEIFSRVKQTSNGTKESHTVYRPYIYAAELLE